MVITAWLVSELMLQVFFSRSAAGFVPPSGLQRPPGPPQPPLNVSRLREERAGKGGGVETRDLDAETAAAGRGDT